MTFTTLRAATENAETDLCSSAGGSMVSTH